MGRCNTISGSGANAALRETLRHWVLWNSFIDKIASWTFQLEKVTGHVFAEILQRSRIKTHLTASSFDKAIRHAGKHANTNHTLKPKESLTWAQLAKLDTPFTIMAQIMCKSYGYSIPAAEIVHGHTNHV